MSHLRPGHDPEGDTDARLSPLEDYINARKEAAVLRRIKAQRYLQGIGGSFVRKRIWRWPFRHMRSHPWHLGKLQPTDSGAWEISNDSGHVTDTVPLREWIGRIDRPVSIIAGGPSARDYPLGRRASGERMVVAVNGVPALLAEHDIVPDAWIVADLRLAEMIRENSRHAASTPLAIPAAVASTLAMTAPGELASRSVCVIERVNQWHGVRSLEHARLEKLSRASGAPFVFPAAGDGKSMVGWSHRPELGFFSGCTVAFAALQIVIGLGARDIEIIGMDLTGKGHAYAETKGSIPSTLDEHYEQRILPSFALMSEALKGTGVAVRNLSPVCRLPSECFPD